MSDDPLFPERSNGSGYDKRTRLDIPSFSGSLDEPLTRREFAEAMRQVKEWSNRLQFGRVGFTAEMLPRTDISVVTDQVVTFNQLIEDSSSFHMTYKSPDLTYFQVPPGLGRVYVITYTMGFESCVPLASTNYPGTFAAGSWENIVYNAGRYVAVVRGVGIGWSTDGITWTFVVGAGVHETIAWDGGVYATFDANASPEAMYSSTDGVTWTLRNSVLTGFSVSNLLNVGYSYSMRCNGTTFVCAGSTTGGNTTNPNVFYSADAVTWTGVHLGVGTAPTLATVANVGSAFYISGSLAGATQLYKSTNEGVSWTSLGVPISTVFSSPFVFGGRSPRIIMVTRSTSDVTPNRLWSSINDGVSWVEHTVPTNCVDILNVVFDANKYYMAILNNTGANRIYQGASLDSLTVMDTAQTYYTSSYLMAANPSDDGVVTIQQTGSPDESLWFTDIDC